MRQFIHLLIILAFMSVIASLALGASNASVSLGGVASNLLEPVGVFSDFIHSACWIIGGSFLFASVIKYRDHKRSPTMVPISTVVFLVIAGFVLVLLPFLSIVLKSGVPYTLISMR